MKCTNPVPCDGEMKTYEGLAEGLVECVTCGFRVSSDPAPQKKASKKTEQILPTENKENI